MLNALVQFRENIQYAHNLGGIHNAVATLITPVLDLSDLLRAQHVQCVSALDFYIHEITRLGMLEIYDRKRLSTDAYLKFKIPMNHLSDFPDSVELRNRFESEIKAQHGYLSFQHPDKIAEAIRLFSSKALWDSVGLRLGVSAKALKNNLILIIDRRNKIVHEADMDPSFPGTRWPIYNADIQASVNFIETLCEAIHAEVT